MLLRDYGLLIVRSLFSGVTRSGLTILGIAMGIAAVVLLTSLGDGLTRYVVNTFTQFGTNLLQIQPGRATTLGATVGTLNTVRPLSVADSRALQRLPTIELAVGFVVGNAEVEGNDRQRRTTIYGTDGDFPSAFNFDLSTGTYLPQESGAGARPLAVLGSKMRDELFGDEHPVGKFIRVGGYRFRVAGVMASKGQMLGFDLDDTVYIPVERAMAIFNRDSLVEIDLLYRDSAPVDQVLAEVKQTLLDRHGVEDFTILTQQQMLETLGTILGALTLGVAAIGGISLLVGGIGILTILTIAVRERRQEIGLLRSLGAGRAQIMLLFLGEAGALAALGGAVGLFVGLGAGQLLHLFLPGLPISPSWFYAIAALLMAVILGMLAGIAPAMMAASLTPVDALREG